MSTTWDTLHHSTEKGTDDWRTPRAFFDAVAAHYPLVIDAAASPANAMLPRYWTAEDDALKQDWDAATAGGTQGAVWCNPPYGRGMDKWLEKARRERARGVTTVVLLFARTDTAWWHDHAMRADRVFFVRGRLSFERPDGTKGAPAPAPSALLVYYGSKAGLTAAPVFSTWEV